MTRKDLYKNMYLFKYEIYGFDGTAFIDTGIIHGNNIGEAASFLAEYYGDTIEELKIEYATDENNAPYIIKGTDVTK